jgi:hypothetical protein
MMSFPADAAAFSHKGCGSAHSSLISRKSSRWGGNAPVIVGAAVAPADFSANQRDRRSSNKAPSRELCPDGSVNLLSITAPGGRRTIFTLGDAPGTTTTDFIVDHSINAPVCPGDWAYSP